MSKSIIHKLVLSGLVPKEYEEVATRELDNELKRRSRRIARTLAALVSLKQLASHCSQLI